VTERRRLPPPAAVSAMDILDKAVASNQAKPRTNAGSFTTNHVHINRKARGPNKNTMILREACILAMKDAAKGLLTKRGLPYSGVVGYLTWAATKEPAAFLSFVGKAVLPVQIKHDLNAHQSVDITLHTIEEVRAELVKRGLPVPLASVFALEHHKDIDDAEPEPPRTKSVPSAPVQVRSAPVQAAPVQEVLSPANPRIRPDLERYSRVPALYREPETTS
jgi:hypothetical protein